MTGKFYRYERLHFSIQLLSTSVNKAEVVNDPSSLNLVECARYIIQDVVGKSRTSGFQIVLVLHIPRVAGGFFTGLSNSQWVCGFVDELRSSPYTYIHVAKIKGKTVGEILSDKDLVDLGAMIVDCLPHAVG